MTVRQAVLLVGGRATRMWPITAEIPKALLPVAGRPFINLQLDALRAVGVQQVFLTVGHAFLDEWETFASDAPEGLAIELIVEDEPLDTAGGVRSALDRLDDRFLVLNGDVVLDGDLSLLVGPQPDGVVGTLALVEVDDTSPYGVVVVDADARVERFLEKETAVGVADRTVNAGAYLLSAEALAGYQPGPLSFERTVFPDLAARRELSAVTIDARWLDIGTPTLYLDAHAAVLGAKDSWQWVAPDAVVEDGATVDQAVILPGARIEADAVVRRAVVGWDARIGRATVVDGESMIGARAVIGAGCEVSRGARVGADVLIGDGALIFNPPQ